MNREKAREILGENATEEQINALLTSVFESNKESNATIKGLQEQLGKYSDYDTIKQQLDDINKAKMTEQEKLDAIRKETEENYRKSKIIVNTAKAKDILAGLEIDDDIISALISDDESKTIAIATKLKDKINNIKDTTKKETTESLANVDLKPTISNVNQSEEIMTLDKFNSLSMLEQKQWKDANPELYEQLKN